jgi:hydroxymethylbilane synthase
MPPPTPNSKSTFNIGTRKSALALRQADLVLSALTASWPDHSFSIRARDTAAGDIDKVTPFKDMPVKNLWTHDLEVSLMEGELDLLVHSLKGVYHIPFYILVRSTEEEGREGERGEAYGCIDVPTQLPDNCTLGAIMKREDPRDAYVLKAGRPACSLADLPPGSVIGTSSIRRTAQIKAKYPHLRVEDMRGNIPTRLRKLDEEGGVFDALILAAAGLIRLGLGERITQFLSSKDGGMLHAVGQGAVGVESRVDDECMAEILGKISDGTTSLACLAERSLLRKLEGGCSAPLGVETEWISAESGAEPKLELRSVVVSVDGKQSVETAMQEHISTPEAAEAFGIKVAEALVAKGADRILAVIKAKKRTEVMDLQD